MSIRVYVGMKGEGAVEVEATEKEVPGNKEQKWANSRSVEIKGRWARAEGRDWKEKESRGRSRERWSRGCPSWSPEDIRGLIEFTSSLVGPTDVGRAGRSVLGHQIQRTPLVRGRFPPSIARYSTPAIIVSFTIILQTAENFAAAYVTAIFDTIPGVRFCPLLRTRWWTLDGLSILVQGNTLFLRRNSFFI